MNNRKYDLVLYGASGFTGRQTVQYCKQAAPSGLRWAIARLPRAANTNLRLALANLVRPGAGTAGVVTALGLGLTLLATVTLLGHTITAQVRDELPESAPSFFFIDIQPDQAAQNTRFWAGVATANMPPPAIVAVFVTNSSQCLFLFSNFYRNRLILAARNETARRPCRAGEGKRFAIGDRPAFQRDR